MTGRRELATALLLQVAGAGLALVASGRHWVELRGVVELGVVPHLGTGADMRPVIPALAWVVLAGALAVVATRGRLRAALGGAVLLCGAGMLAVAVHWLLTFPIASDGQESGVRLGIVRTWALLVVLSGVLVVVGGALTVLRGRGWAGLGASYEAPGGAPEAPVTEKAVWDALDRGDDPTA